MDIAAYRGKNYFTDGLLRSITVSALMILKDVEPPK